ncbi:MAG: cyclic nucleotide-binding domain-containing protein [Chloroflexi bacterium]|nr:cyclic nucleotide-binding domain-containing protein [Chloroflexota bacterium]
MPTERSEILLACKNTPFFRKLDDDQFQRVVEYFRITSRNEGRVLYAEGVPADRFYIIVSGKVKVAQIRKGKEKRSVILGQGDVFGEEALSPRRRRSALAVALTETILLYADQKTLQKVTREYSALKPNLEIIRSTHRMAQHTRFDWLTTDEPVYLISRRHGFFLARALIGPLAACFFALVLIYLFNFVVLPGSLLPVALAGLIYLGALGWGVWSVFDWGNDYYVTTDRRVVWMERVAGFYDSRQEAPLSTLLSVGVKTTQLGRMLGFGDVLVRTYTGTMTLNRIGHPDQVASLIEAYWFRTKVITRQAEAAAMGVAIRQRLGLNRPGETARTAAAQSEGQPPVEVQPGWLQTWFANIFHVRFEQDGVITYRKHWFILVKKTWKPLILTGVALALGGASLAGAFTLLSASTAIILCSAAAFGGCLWLLYRYVDWHDDVYQVTPDQIVDIERTPLGKEERKAAPLDNILSIEFQRNGIIGLILNFGTVTIMIGNAQFTFDYVYNPSQVQQDVFRHMAERVNKKREAEAHAERERVSEWIAAYHESLHPPKDQAGDAKADFPPGSF